MTKEIDINPLLDEIIKETQLKQEEIAAKLDYNADYFSQARQKGTLKLYNTLVRFRDEFRKSKLEKESKTPPEEHEPEFVSEGKEIIKNGNLVKNPNLKHHRGHGRVINFYDVDFMAGNIEFYEDRQLTQPAYTMDIPEFSGCTAFRVYNDSMEPLIKSGTIVFGTEIFHWQEYLDYGQIYGIIRHANTPLLKYIRKSPLGKEYLLMKSENPNYDEFDLPVKEIKGIWLIHGWINKRT